MTERQAFKFGFLSRCAVSGLLPHEIPIFVKRAIDVLGPAVEATKATAGLVIPAAILTPLVLGGLAGYGLARISDVGPTPDDVKTRELIDTYRQEAERLRRIKEDRQKRRQAKLENPPYQRLS